MTGQLAAFYRRWARSLAARRSGSVLGPSPKTVPKVLIEKAAGKFFDKQKRPACVSAQAGRFLFWDSGYSLGQEFNVSVKGSGSAGIPSGDRSCLRM